MKTFTTILKVLAALAIIAGIVYVAINYGDKIVAWFKKMFHICTCKNECDECTCESDCIDCHCGGCDADAVMAAEDDFVG